MPEKHRTKRAVIFANGILGPSEVIRDKIEPEDLIIAADGGNRHCRELELTPAIVIGDFDSLSAKELTSLEAAGTDIIRHPAQKDYTDLELAIRHTQTLGVKDILIVAALGERWDQTLANLLLPAAQDLAGVHIRLLDGSQEILLIRSGENLEIHGQSGDTVSLIPLGGDVCGITTSELAYPLNNEMLRFGATRGISNVMLSDSAAIHVREGLLLCILIHSPE